MTRTEEKISTQTRNPEELGIWRQQHLKPVMKDWEYSTLGWESCFIIAGGGGELDPYLTPDA